MADVYDGIEVTGSSSYSMEEAIQNAVKIGSQSLNKLMGTGVKGEVEILELKVVVDEKGQVVLYRARSRATHF